MMKSGASGYITKTSPIEEMTEAIMTIYQGGKYICNEARKNLPRSIIQSCNHANKFIKFNQLSGREQQVLAFIQKGCTSGQIAAFMNISLSAVEACRSAILRKRKIDSTVLLINHNWQWSIDRSPSHNDNTVIREKWVLPFC